MSLPPRHWPTAALTLWRTFGARGAALRAVHEARSAAGAFRAAARHSVDAAPAGETFQVDRAALKAAVPPELARGRGDRVADGWHQAYRWEWRPLPHTAAGWLEHPASGVAADGAAPWWRVPHFAAHGDIKDLWEPARFGWAYDLVRAWKVTGDDRYARAFHEHVARWAESSPPFRGPHWSCGQETAIRAVALLYAEANLADAPSSDARAMGLLARTLAASGERIADAVGYAVSQRNNHAISEAAGLVVLGLRFRGSHPEAGAWLARGRRLLERLVREQFAPDGWYVQHSFTYLRLALDQCVVAERALRAAGLALGPGAVRRILAAADLLLAMMDPESGEVPNHGPNDGAFVHPVTSAPYRDFRPVATAVGALWRHPLPADVRPDAETLAWLGLEAPPRGPAMADGVRSGPSGWAVARIDGTVVFLRAGSYRSRPGDVDPLHVDVRVGGREVVVDPGTYAYNAPPPWRNGLSGAEVHNGPIVAGRAPGVRGPRFLWYLWPRAELREARRTDAGARLVAVVPSSHERTVTVTAGRVLVEDRLLGGPAPLAVRWLLHPRADASAVEVEGPHQVRQARDGAVAGWYSPHYGQRVPSTYVEAERVLRGGDALRTTIHAGRPGPEGPRAGAAPFARDLQAEERAAHTEAIQGR